MHWFLGALSGLLEGYAGSKVAATVQGQLANDKDYASADIQRSTELGSPPGGGFMPGAGGSYSGLAEYLTMERDVLSRYVEYDEMDEFPELCTALDIYADDATRPDSLRGVSVWVSSEDEEIRDLGNKLLHETLRVEEDGWGIVRTLAKYGNAYGELMVRENVGVVGIAFMPPATVRRVETANNALLGFAQHRGTDGILPEDFNAALRDRFKEPSDKPERSGFDDGGRARHRQFTAFEPWEVVHWRLRGKWMRSRYGVSVMDPARWIWRRMVLLEDAALLYKLTRAPARYAYYIDVGDLSAPKAEAYVDAIRRKHRKKKYVNDQGKLEFTLNPLSVDEDLWVPSRGGKDSTRVEMVNGADWQSMEDMKYFRQKLLAAIKVPPEYIGMGEGGGDVSGSASTRDVRFASSVARIQREYLNGLRKVFRVHLAALGIDPYSVKWDIHAASASSIFELGQIEVRNAQADLAARMEPFASKEWILENVFRFTKDEIKEMQASKDKDREKEAMQGADLQIKVNKKLGLPPGAETPDLPGQDDDSGGGDAPAAAKPAETSKEDGTGDKRTSPNKGRQRPKAAGESWETRLRAIRSRHAQRSLTENKVPLRRRE